MRKKFGFWVLPLGGLALGLILTIPLLAPTHTPRAAPPPNTTVKYNPDTGIPDWLDGPLPYTLSADEQADPEQAARNILNRFRDVFGITDANTEFQLARIETDALGQTHVRLQQVKDGVPVWGRVLLVHLGEGKGLGINGDYQPEISLTTSPSLTAAQAESLALAADTGIDPHVDGSQLMIYVDETDQQSYLTWFVKVEALITHNTGYFVDAHDGVIRHITPLAAADLYREVYDLQGKDSFPGKLLATEGTVPRDIDGATAYKNAGTVYNYFLKNFQRDSFDDNGANLYLLIHSPELGNSFWNGEAMIFGDADGYIASKNDALVLDIMAHELTHAVTQYTAGLEYENQSGALNESFSDVFAVMVDRDDWHLFEENTVCSTFPKGHCWMRDMQDPSLGGDYDADDPRAGFGQPMHMNEYANLPNAREGDWGGVHINSGIPNHVLYLAVTGSSREATEQIWYRALSTYLTPRSDFSDFATAIQKSTVDLYGQNSREVTAVTNALKQVGILGGAPEPTPVATTPPNAQVNPTPAPVTTAGCTELVGNGTFEGSRPAPWTERTNLGAPIIAEEFPRTGRKSAWLGGTDQESFQYIYQDISIAANMRGVTLTYWHYVEENVNPGAPDAEFNALLADTSGNVIADLEKFVSSEPDTGWAQSAIDLSEYAGKKVRLAFTADMVRGNLSNFFVDDVSVSGCTSGGATTPTTGGASVTVQGTITDSRTGKPIEGAEFYILNVTVDEASADGRLTDSEVMASGISDRK
ncbi:MAG TPA: M4 family metallopeptidase, partial [Anaerolineales bacterium]|nr:M4 family metallopeptidase [Anaerolineales bacterium]